MGNNLSKRDIAGILNIDTKTLYNWKKNKPELYRIVMLGFKFDELLKQAQNNLEIVTDKWESKYPKLMSSWYSEWNEITPIFKFSVKVRTVIYTTNAVESVNSRLRSMNKKRSVFPNKVSLEKALYLDIERIVKEWTGAIRDWGQIYGELRIMHEDRI